MSRGREVGRKVRGREREVGRRGEKKGGRDAVVAIVAPPSGLLVVNTISTRGHHYWTSIPLHWTSAAVFARFNIIMSTSKQEDPAVKNFRDYLRLKCMHPNPNYG